jgi:hypothetical protein
VTPAEPTFFNVAQNDSRASSVYQEEKCYPRSPDMLATVLLLAVAPAPKEDVRIYGRTDLPFFNRLYPE